MTKTSKVAIALALPVALLIVVVMVGVYKWRSETNWMRSSKVCTDSGADGFLKATLGGVHVKIPTKFANYVEYDGQESVWNKKQPSDRTCKNDLAHIGSIRSFGFQFDFNAAGDFEEPQPLLKGTMRQRFIVGFNAGENFPGDLYLTRRLTNITSDVVKTHGAEYRNISSDAPGLKKMAHPLSGLKPAPGEPERIGSTEKDLYFAVDGLGNVTTLILCDARVVVRPRCKHHFSLQPKMKVAVYTSYSRQEMENWMRIQESVTRVVLGFAQ